MLRAVLIVLRLVLGRGVGLASVVVPLYISEISPQQVRGSLTSLNQLMITAGILLAYITAFALSPFDAWRLMLGLAIVPAILLFVGMYFMPESPRWLVEKGRVDQAREVLGRTRDDQAVEQEIQGLQEASRKSRGQQAGWNALLAAWVRPALIAGVGLAALQQFIGINTIIYYAPTVFSQIGFGDSTSIAVNVGIGFVNFAFTFLAIRLIDQVGRKPLLLAGNVGMVLAMTVGGIFLLLTSSASAFVAIITLLCLATYIGFFAATWGPVLWAMLPELFPTHIRGAAEGVSTMSNWGANFIVALIFPVLLTTVGEGPVFLVFAVIGVLAFIFVQRRVPETKGKSLEQIEAELRSGSW
ncbi:MAG: sugar porter family MFS transporter [Rubrobacteraceae bacterium]